jgi:hypothetical protein
MIYCAAYSNYLAAGPAIVVVTHFNNDPPAAESVGKLNIMENLETYLDKIEDGVDFESEYALVQNHEVNYLGYYRAISPVVERLVARFKVKYTVRTPVILYSKGCVGSLGDSFIRVDPSNPQQWNKSFYTLCLAKYYSSYWMSNYYHEFYPVYEWNKNHGFPSSRHLDIILERGPIPELHRRETLLRLSQRWYERVLTYDPWALSQDWLIDPPDWWPALFPNVHFCFSLSTKQLTELRNINNPTIDVAIFKWIRKSSKLLPSKSSYRNTLYYKAFRPGEVYTIDTAALVKDLKLPIITQV